MESRYSSNSAETAMIAYVTRLMEFTQPPEVGQKFFLHIPESGGRARVLQWEPLRTPDEITAGIYTLLGVSRLIIRLDLFTRYSDFPASAEYLGQNHEKDAIMDRLEGIWLVITPGGLKVKFKRIVGSRLDKVFKKPSSKMILVSRDRLGHRTQLAIEIVAP